MAAIENIPYDDIRSSLTFRSETMLSNNLFDLMEIWQWNNKKGIYIKLNLDEEMKYFLINNTGFVIEEIEKFIPSKKTKFINRKMEWKRTISDIINERQTDRVFSMKVEVFEFNLVNYKSVSTQNSKYHLIPKHFNITEEINKSNIILDSEYDTSDTDSSDTDSSESDSSDEWLWDSDEIIDKGIQDT